MHDFPHIYRATVIGKGSDNLIAQADGLPNIEMAPPLQFDGPGDQWSPEDLLMASVSSCLVLSFKAIARASKFEWTSLECESIGDLNKVERKLMFTSVLSKVKLLIPAGGDEEKAQKLLIKAEESCLISNSLSCESSIECDIVVADA